MVNPAIYHPQDPRRYGSPHRVPYPHHYMPVDPRRPGSGPSTPFEPQRNMSSEDVSSQRKRIPVAVGLLLSLDDASSNQGSVADVESERFGAAGILETDPAPIAEMREPCHACSFE